MKDHNKSHEGNRGYKRSEGAKNGGMRGRMSLAQRSAAAFSAAKSKRRVQYHPMSVSDRYAEIYRLSPIAFISVDENAQIHDLNPAAATLLGRELAELYGEFLHYCAKRDDLGRVYRHLQRVFHDIGTTALEFRLERPAGNTLDVQLQTVYVDETDGATKLCHALLLDISERKHMERTLNEQCAALAHYDRLNMIGETTASFAHEVTQPLAVILTYTQICLRMLKRGQPSVAALGDILKKVAMQAEHAGQTVRQIRKFARREAPQKQWCCLNKIAQESVLLVEHDLREHQINLQLLPAKGLPLFYADPLQIKQVIINLIRNAIQALESGTFERREIVVSTSPGDSGEGLLAVADTGPGIAADDAATIFERFFTTKADGMGLGLALSRAIIENHGGRLWVDPQVEHGCIFRFALPCEGRPG